MGGEKKEGKKKNKQGNFDVAFYCCLPRADDPGFEQRAAPIYSKVNKADERGETFFFFWIVLFCYFEGKKTE